MVESQIHCIVAIGTGAPSVGPFGKDVLAMRHILLTIAAETEMTHNSFQKDQEFC